MSRYAWASPTNGVREQDDDLIRATGRIQEALKLQENEVFGEVVLYEQRPRLHVSRETVYSVAPKRRTRFLDWLRLKLRKKPHQPEEWFE